MGKYICSLKRGFVISRFFSISFTNLVPRQRFFISKSSHSAYNYPPLWKIATSSPVLFPKKTDKALGTRLEKENCQGLNYQWEVFDVKTRSQVNKLILTLFFKIHFCFNLLNKVYPFWADPKSASVICVNGSRSFARAVSIESREDGVGNFFLWAKYVSMFAAILKTVVLIRPLANHWLQTTVSPSDNW